MLKYLRNIRPFISLIIMIGLVLSGLNPICQHSSTSKMLLEICSGNSIKTIEVDVGNSPVSPDEEPPLKSDEKCPYCFAAQMAKFVPESSSLDTPHIVTRNVYGLPKGNSVLKFSRAGSYEARAPPFSS